MATKENETKYMCVNRDVKIGGTMKRRKSPDALNARERAILKYIEKEIEENGYAPSVREIGKKVGLRSTATVHGYVARLTELGYLKKEDKKGRTLRLLKNSKGEASAFSSRLPARMVKSISVSSLEIFTLSSILSISSAKKRNTFS